MRISDWSSDVCSSDLLIGPMMFNSIAEPMQRTDTGIAAPGKHQPISTAHADHLVVDDVGRHTDQGEVASFLTNDLMRCPKGDQMCKTFERNALAIADECRDHVRSEEHTSELQSLMRISYAVFCLKKKKYYKRIKYKIPT